MSFKKLKKSGKFIHCPNCDGKNISQTDYEIDDEDTEDEEGRACDDCGWEGDDSELVSSRADADAKQAKNKADAEAAEAQRQREQEERRERATNLYQTFGVMFDSKSCEGDLITIEHRGHRYEIREIEEPNAR